MPKARKHKKGTAKKTQTPTNRTSQPAAEPVKPVRRAFVSPAARGPQSLITPAIVALGCWGLAVSFAFFYSDPNHLLYGGVAAAMALLWSGSFALRVRKFYALRQRA